MVFKLVDLLIFAGAFGFLVALTLGWWIFARRRRQPAAVVYSVLAWLMVHAIASEEMLRGYFREGWSRPIPARVVPAKGAVR